MVRLVRWNDLRGELNLAADGLKTRIAVVGLGGAGTSIVMVLNRYLEDKNLADVFVINSEKYTEFKRFYFYHQLEDVIESLKPYRYVLLTAGLGSTGGDLLVGLTKRLSNIKSIFVSFPFSVEDSRVKRAVEQLNSMDVSEIHVVNLNFLLQRMPNMPIIAALEIVNEEIVAKILDEIFEYSNIKNPI